MTAAGAARTVAEFGWDDQRALTAHLHGGNAFVPPLDDHADADAELERLAAIERAVELRAFLPVLIEPAGIVHHARLARLGRGAGAFGGVDDLQARRCGHGFLLLCCCMR